MAETPTMLELEQVRARLAKALRDNAAIQAAVDDRDRELVNLRIRDTATCAYVAAWLDTDVDMVELRGLERALIEAYRATTPQPEGKAS